MKSKYQKQNKDLNLVLTGEKDESLKKRNLENVSHVVEEITILFFFTDSVVGFLAYMGFLSHHLS